MQLFVILLSVVFLYQTSAYAEFEDCDITKTRLENLLKTARQESELIDKSATALSFVGVQSFYIVEECKRPKKAKAFLCGGLGDLQSLISKGLKRSKDREALASATAVLMRLESVASENDCKKSWFIF